MMTGDEYKKSLVDGRATYYKGQRVLSLPDHPVLGPVVDRLAAEYDRFAEAASGGATSPLSVPRSAEELRARIDERDDTSLLAHITSTCVMTLVTAAARLDSPAVSERVESFIEDAQRRDVRITECITDGKGDRALPPGAQPDPDAYTRVVERLPDGVVIRGAKLHITGASLGHELLVMPTKAMKAGEEDYAITCVVPVSAEGVKIVDTLNNPYPGDEESYPFSSRNYFPEGFVIFDDVFVPHDRVFLDGGTREASVFAHSLGLWERAGGLSVLAERSEVLVGLAHLAAEANGLLKVPHIKDKLSGLMLQATLIRSALDSAITHCKVGIGGAVFPDELYTNAGKLYGASHYNDMTREVWDICGGSLATAPLVSDLANEDVGPLIRKHMRGAVDGEYRLRLLLAIRDVTALNYGSWRAITALQSGGGLHAQRTVLRKHYDIDAAREKALGLIGLSAPRSGVTPPTMP